MLKIKNVYKSYIKDKLALSDVNLEIKEGEIFAFIGHNGAGKTTMIKSIVGLIPFDSGTIELGDLNIVNEPKLFKNNIAYIPDTPFLYDNLTGAQFLNFISSIYKLDPNNTKDEIIKYANLLEIENRLSDLIETYSHGMRQKLLLISAIIRKPKLFILDEPFVGLDPLATFNVKEIMKEMAKDGTIIFFSTHILEVAEKLATTVAIIKDGIIVVDGKMADVMKDKSLENVFLELANE